MPDTYLCPGESQPIGRAIHLARLASFYAGCQKCSHRHDMGLLPLSTRKHLEQHARLPERAPEFHAEGVQGVFHNQLTVSAARRLAAAFGIVLREQLRCANRQPRDPVVVLAGDGRPITAEFLAAAGEGLRYCGCHVLETSSATSGMLAFAMHQQGADGGLLLGNPADHSHFIGLKFWGPGCLPWSRGGELNAIERLQCSPINRPTRTAGTASRLVIEPEYLQGLQGYFHALRPLRLLLDTTSTTLKRLLRQLASRVACTVIDDDDATGGSNPVSPSGESARKRSARLGRRVQAAGADFGVWTDGDGEAVLLVDERGREVPHQKLLLVLARHVRSANPVGPVVIEPEESGAASQRFCDMLEQASAAADGSRRGMAAAMGEKQAVLGGGASGRYWLPPSPAPDALHLIAVLLTILSTRDWPLSEVIERCLEPAGSCR